MTTETTDIHREIRKADDVFEEMFRTGDLSTMGEFYTDDAVLMPTGMDMLTGKAAILAFWKGALEMGIKGVKLDPVEVERHDDTAIEVGRYHLSAANGVALDKGKYIVVWKQGGGRWKVSRDIWNSSQPPA